MQLPLVHPLLLPLPQLLLQHPTILSPGISNSGISNNGSSHNGSSHHGSIDTGSRSSSLSNGSNMAKPLPHHRHLEVPGGTCHPLAGCVLATSSTDGEVAGESATDGVMRRWRMRRLKLRQKLKLLFRTRKAMLHMRVRARARKKARLPMMSHSQRSGTRTALRRSSQWQKMLPTTMPRRRWTSAKRNSLVSQPLHLHLHLPLVLLLLLWKSRRTRMVA
mmetsp:Transcript_96396/g.210794  ORF Transcript_96396/g.210794 Transcript_96396/m.210794 type:complete len:219 (+) Transcript_96396:387-1043(+)